MFKNLLKSGLGTKLSLIGALVSLLVVILYPVFYAGKIEMNWLAFVFSLLAIGSVGAGIVSKKLEIAQLGAFVFSLLGFVFYFLGVWNYFFDFIVGIDVTTLSAGFIISTILFIVQLVLTLLASIFINEKSQD